MSLVMLPSVILDLRITIFNVNHNSEGVNIYPLFLSNKKEKIEKSVTPKLTLENLYATYFYLW